MKYVLFGISSLVFALSYCTFNPTDVAQKSEESPLPSSALASQKSPKPETVRFVAFGDFGTGSNVQKQSLENK